MARNNDNYYVRAQEEANRIATKQLRALSDIERNTKASSKAILRLAAAFETLAKVLAQQHPIHPGAGRRLVEKLSSDAGPDAPSGGYGTSSLPKPQPQPRVLTNQDRVPIVPEGADGGYTREQIAKYGEGKPYPKVNITPTRLGYGDVIEAHDERIELEREGGASEDEVERMGLVIGVDLSEERPEEKALIAARGTVEGNDRLTIVCDEAATRELLLDVEEDAQSLAVSYDMVDVDDMMIEEQRRGLVHRVRKVLERRSAPISDSPAEAAAVGALERAIATGEHPPVLDGLEEDMDLPLCGFCGDTLGLPGCPTHGEVLPPGVTPAMMAKHPDFAERIRSTPNYHQINQDASKRQREQERAIPITRHGHFFVPTEPGKDIPVTRNGEEIGRATINEDGTGTISIDGEASGPSKFATGGYTGVSTAPFAEPRLAGSVHPPELFGTSKTLKEMWDAGAIAEGTILNVTNAEHPSDRTARASEDWRRREGTVDGGNY